MAKHLDTNQTVDHFFRHEYGRTVSFLTQRFGSEHFDAAEDAVQETLEKAMQVWPFKGTPDNPSAWVLRVAHNKLVDHLRRVSSFNKKSEALIAEADKYQLNDDVSLEGELSDDFLKMMFACCHPSLSAESQIILVLKVLAGFGKSEIAKALLKSEEAIAKAYTRAKAKFKNHNPALVVPIGDELEQRLSIITKIIYLIFNEGYNSISQDKLINNDLCYEAMRLNKLLLDNKSFQKPQLHALMSLMCFQSSRFESRIGDKGRLLTLDEQDRKTWNYDLIKLGRYYLQLSTTSGLVSEYHLQACIAACHSFANSFATTDWEKILVLYDALVSIKPDVIIKLNRVVALAKVKGAKAGLEEIKKLPADKLNKNYIFYAIHASLQHQLGCTSEAILNYKKALSLTMNQSERAHLKSKIELISS